MKLISSGRIDFQDKLERERSKSMEFVWKSSPSLGKQSDLFTSVLPNVYWPPNGFCFDMNCYDEPIDQYNAQQRANEFIQHVKSQANSYATRHTIITMGMDFYYRDASKWFDNLDLLISKVNELGALDRVHLLYSTPECYLKALRDEYGAQVGVSSSLDRLQMTPVTRWPVKIDDFFPYADVMNAYWTGYFTSRPSLKFHIKQASNELTAAKQLSVLAGINPFSAQLRLNPLKQSLAILQHHDAVTGTCKQFVSDDYHRMLSLGMAEAEDLISEALQKLMRRNDLPTYIPRPMFCERFNESRCPLSENFLASGPNGQLRIVVYNPIAHELKHYLRVPIGGAYIAGQLTVFNDVTGQFVDSQVH